MKDMSIGLNISNDDNEEKREKNIKEIQRVLDK